MGWGVFDKITVHAAQPQVFVVFIFQDGVDIVGGQRARLVGGEMAADTCVFVEAIYACAVTACPYVAVSVVAEGEEYVFFQEVFPVAGLCQMYADTLIGGVPQVTFVVFENCVDVVVRQ